ncbi:conserved hypothetical protein [Methanococcus vannielii SB]|uniref:Cell division protein SepF n=1 Tax=Methanococcus vannielii (strain ATCC 35089 / DSM 1224 / JCM 13029 / OCM 148 / SB) TaxID=406327 RepID=A6UQS9_METVS|nr:cell division protein SepF [Methanococcus vannielii]ABR54851.1 conserved hypothetical protein [Methanococcus vannielii SB]
MFKKIKKMISGGDTLKTNNPVPIEEYVDIPVRGYEGSNVIKIKVCDLEDFKDATDIAVLTEAGYLVIANTINLERDLDDDYAKVLASLKEKVGKVGGKIVRLCESKVMAVPSNTIIEKVVRDDASKK